MNQKRFAQSYSRREMLKALGLGSAAIFFGYEQLRSMLDGAAGFESGAMAANLPGCVVRPEQTEGPYFVDEKLNRSDIRVDPSDKSIRPGVPLRLEFRVSRIAGGACDPLSGAMVDVWHCDAGGAYSGFAQEGTEGETFMRGIQRTDRKGVARFTTVYPGWYSGRTVHIHVQVSAGGNVLHTGQLFFPERLTDAVFRRAPYNRRPNRDTRNAADSIFRNGGARSMLRLARQGSGYVGRITMGISRS